jgi:hypothetical protein
MMDTCCWLNLPFMKGYDAILNRLEGLLLLGEMRLLVPRVIIEEFERHKEEIATRKVRSMRSHIKEVRSVGKELLEGAPQASLFDSLQQLHERIEELSANSVTIIARIDAIFVHANTVVIETTEAYLARAGRRGYDKRAPFVTNKNSVADGVIIEMFSDRVQQQKADDVLYFVSENKTDFSDPENHNRPHPDFAEIFNDGDHVKYSLNVAETLNEIAASVLPTGEAEPIPEEVVQEVDAFVERQQAEQLDWLRRRPAAFLDTDNLDAAYHPAYYQRRQFPWAALDPIPPHQALVMPQDEILAFENPQSVITHGPPPNTPPSPPPPPPQPVVAKPPDESIAFETPPSFTTHGPPPKPPTEPEPERTEPPKTS